jgi:hypothetical protein
LLPNLIVLDVEPLLAPVLDGLSHLEVKLVGFTSNRNNSTTDVVNSVLRRDPSDKENAHPEVLVWLDAKETLTERDKTRNVTDRIRHELMQLHVVHKEKPMPKFVGRKRKTSKKKGHEHYPKSRFWPRHNLVAYLLDLRCLGDQASFS